MSRRVRIYSFSIWAGKVLDARSYLEFQETRTDLAEKLARPDDPLLLRSAKLDSDWDAEVLRCLTVLSSPRIEFLPAKVFGTIGLFELLDSKATEGEERWVFFYGQNPAYLEERVGEIVRELRQRGFQIFYWSFDDASRRINACVKSIAPYLSVLIHDEEPLDASVAALLSPHCSRLHSSWLANLVPFSVPFREHVEPCIVFLGSQAGLTPHRKRQLDFLASTFGDAFKAITDHSVEVKDRSMFAGYKVHFCPEGRMFTTHSMRLSHTDRPFWAGCMGQVPVVENSKWGSRLEELATDGLVFRYEHGDMESLKDACGLALGCSGRDRYRIYNRFNLESSIACTIADCIGAYAPAFT